MKISKKFFWSWLKKLFIEHQYKQLKDVVTAMILHEYLKNPKTIDQLVTIAKENGLYWNRAQIELFVRLDPSIIQNAEGLWTVKQDERRQMILAAIERALQGRPMTKIDPDVFAQLPADVIVPQSEIIDVAISSGKYESPRENLLRVKRN
ncbi:hypothetical protein P9204_14245 [Geobacillus stearothermophilus]|uniref:hypothetical protein n=2 Tax=Anoxybacillaceae TaxID=3120669 RepID=UPI0007B29A1F|nr:hypothetical protein AVP43_02359 [Geobacillus stearothermophilus]MED4301543.1 hypothetical protein [Geobacillus stearothermophilus]